MKPLFRWEGKISLLQSEFVLQGSHKVVDPLIIFHDGIWHSFFNENKLEESLNKGLDFFSDKENYQRYEKEFKEYIKELKALKISKKISKNEFIKLCGIISKLWEFYGYTEYFYTDKVFENNFDHMKNFGDLKIKGREALNHIAFKDGLLFKVLNSVAKQFLDKRNDIYFMTYEEILSLYEGKKICIEHSYAIQLKNNDIIRHSDTKKLLNDLNKSDNTKEIRGLAANKGFVVGKAVIAPMLTDMKKINQVISKMETGAVLIAQSTTPELMVMIDKAAAIVTDQGGMLSHAAIVSREFNIPCIVGTGNATKILKDGDMIEVDANNGVVRKI